LTVVKKSKTHFKFKFEVVFRATELMYVPLFVNGEVYLNGKPVLVTVIFQNKKATFLISRKWLDVTLR
jgi:hypothetical protein